MQPLFSPAAVKYLLESVKPSTRTSKCSLQPLRGKIKQTSIRKPWVRSPVAENHSGFLASSGATLARVSAEEVMLSCGSQRIRWSKGSSSAQTASCPKLVVLRQGGSLTCMICSQIYGPPLASTAALLGAVFTLVPASTDRETPFYDSQRQSHIVMPFTLCFLVFADDQSRVETTFFSHSTRSEQGAFFFLFIATIFLSSLETSGFDHCQEPINEQDRLLMFSGKAIFIES